MPDSAAQAVNAIPSCQLAIEQWLRARQPASLLVFGEEATEDLTRYAESHVRCRYVALPLDVDSTAVSQLERVDVAFVSPAIEQMDKPVALRLIAALRDRLAASLIVAARTSAVRMTATDFLALGLRRLSTCRHGADEITLHVFEIGDYKDTPDWLNSRHWAHPELFDKFRW